MPQETTHGLCFVNCGKCISKQSNYLDQTSSFGVLNSATDQPCFVKSADISDRVAYKPTPAALSSVTQHVFFRVRFPFGYFRLRKVGNHSMSGAVSPCNMTVRALAWLSIFLQIPTAYAALILPPASSIVGTKRPLSFFSPSTNAPLNTMTIDINNQCY